MGWPTIEQNDFEVVDWHLSGEFDCLATVCVIRSMYSAVVVCSLLKRDHLNLCFTQHFTCEISAAMVAIFNCFTQPRFDTLVHESESSGSQPAHRKMFPNGAQNDVLNT